MPTAAPVLSRKADARLRQPRCRGSFLPVDAARRRLALLSVADGLGQARISWLVDVATGEIHDSRFLAFGNLASHPLADAFSELVRGRTVHDACGVSLTQVESLLQDAPGDSACGQPIEEVGAFILDLQARALAALPELVVLPPPPDTAAPYQRKRVQDFTDVDRAWLPLPLLKKAATVDQQVQRLAEERLPGVRLRTEGVHDDLQVVLSATGLTDEQIATAEALLGEALRGLIHPQLSVAIRT